MQVWPTVDLPLLNMAYKKTGVETIKIGGNLMTALHSYVIITSVRESDFLAVKHLPMAKYI